MANPTTNFGWVMPTSTSLVTNLPADFNTFGQAVDTSMSELLGGTTGQVLSKTSNTNMDFTWVTPTDQTPLTTKGDLFTFTTVDARLAVGNNGETLVADSSTSTGLRYQSAYNGNAIINGGMDIAQRGTSFTNVNGYSLDRWYVNRSGGATGCTVTQSTDAPTGFQYSLRTQRVAANTSTAAIDSYYGLESKDSYRFAGQTATLSFYMKVGANYSGSAVTVRLLSGTATDAAPYSGTTTVVQTNPTTSTTWTRYSITGTFGSGITQAFVSIGWTPVGTAGADDSVYFTGIQLELGSVATSFKRAGATIQGELAACQRYYFAKITAGTNPSTFGMAAYVGGSDLRGTFGFPVEMRVVPTLVATSGTAYYTTEYLADRFDGIVLNWTTKTEAGWYASAGASGTAGTASMVGSFNTAASIALSAEL